MLATLITWVKAHPIAAAGVAAVALATILNLVLAHYGEGHPRLRRALRFAVDLLALLPMRGSPSRGLQLPLLSLSAPPAAKPIDPAARARDDGYGRLLAVLVLLALSSVALLGCASWKATTRTALVTAGRSAYTAAVRADDMCKVVVERCIDKKHAEGVPRGQPYKCDALNTCQATRRAVRKGALDAVAAALAGLAAVSVADEPSARNALLQVGQLLTPVMRALSAHGITLGL